MGRGYGIYAQRFDAAGVAQGGEFRVNTVTLSTQTNPAVAMDADGDVTLIWQSSGQDGSGYGVYAKSFTATGAERRCWSWTWMLPRPARAAPVRWWQAPGRRP